MSDSAEYHAEGIQWKFDSLIIKLHTEALENGFREIISVV